MKKVMLFEEFINESTPKINNVLKVGDFVIPPKNIETYLTPGKKYRVNRIDDWIFTIINDENEETSCLFYNDDINLFGQDWKMA